MLKMMSGSKFFSVFLLGAIVFVITISFIFWGIGPNSGQVSGVLATIEGEKIMLDEYFNKYDDTYRQLSEIYKTKEEMEALNLKESVLTTLINRMVLLITAERAGVKATDEEIRNAIINTPYFQRNGVFDRDLYERILSQNRMTSQTFERDFRNDMIVTKMNRLIGETVELSSNELKIIDSVKEGKEQLTETFLTTKRNQAMQAYIEAQKKRIDIVINRDLLL